ncbi:MAG: hypothetical protein F3745_00485 [Nitrospinae bacterium]|nr:hypothetical protein [Nitrospinota bacterium]MZH01909.1 hypothetical protein [Nitrospinota bacterium]MZH42226.1 hypothetical protein [Nitrospinota bacterium]
MKRLVVLAICFWGAFFMLAGSSFAVSKEYLFPSPSYKPPCDTSKRTICTIEIWLGHKHKKKKKEIRKFLKSNSLKVLGHTVQFWRRGNGHPPTNIAIGSAVSAEDARFVIDFALKYNDRVDGLILRPLNPPNYAAVATSAWDELSEVAITPEELEKLRDPKLTTEEFHSLYYELTNEAGVQQKFY